MLMIACPTCESYLIEFNKKKNIDCLSCGREFSVDVGKVDYMSLADMRVKFELKQVAPVIEKQKAVQQEYKMPNVDVECEKLADGDGRRICLEAIEKLKGSLKRK